MCHGSGRSSRNPIGCPSSSTFETMKISGWVSWSAARGMGGPWSRSPKPRLNRIRSASLSRWSRTRMTQCSSQARCTAARAAGVSSFLRSRPRISAPMASVTGTTSTPASRYISAAVVDGSGCKASSSVLLMIRQGWSVTWARPYSRIPECLTSDITGCPPFPPGHGWPPCYGRRHILEGKVFRCAGGW